MNRSRYIEKTVVPKDGIATVCFRIEEDCHLVSLSGSVDVWSVRAGALYMFEASAPLSPERMMALGVFPLGRIQIGHELAIICATPEGLNGQLGLTLGVVLRVQDSRL